MIYFNAAAGKQSSVHEIKSTGNNQNNNIPKTEYAATARQRRGPRRSSDCSGTSRLMRYIFAYRWQMSVVIVYHSSAVADAAMGLPVFSPAADGQLYTSCSWGRQNPQLMPRVQALGDGDHLLLQ